MLLWLNTITFLTRTNPGYFISQVGSKFLKSVILILKKKLSEKNQKRHGWVRQKKYDIIFCNENKNKEGTCTATG